MTSRPTIIVADDDSDMLNALCMRLQDLDFEVVAVEDSYNALAAAIDKKPDLLILDVNMPAGDGFSVQERFQALEPLAEVPVIYVTGDKSERLDEVAQQHGAAAIFHKPFDSEELIETVHRVLQLKAA